MDILRLKFHTDSEYWRVYAGQMNLYELCNGDRLWIQVGESFYSTRIEWDQEWFITLGRKKFWLHRKTQYRMMPND